MVKPAFENINVECWVHGAKLGLAPNSICLHHSNLQGGVPILHALQEIVDEALPAQRTVTFVPNSRKHAICKLILKIEPPSEQLKVLHIDHAGATLTIRMTHHGQSLLGDALETWLKGGEDFGVGPHQSDIELGQLDRQSSELWFWGPVYFGP